MTVTQTELSNLTDALRSVQSKSSSDLARIRTIADAWRPRARRLGFPPADLYDVILRTDASLRIDIYAVIILADKETNLLVQVLADGEDPGGTTEELEAVAQHIYNLLFIEPTYTFPVYSSDFTRADLREELVQTLWAEVMDAVEMYLDRDPDTNELEGDAYKEKRDEILDYLDDHLVIKFIR